MKSVVIDIEANGLQPTKIHCVSFAEVESGVSTTIRHPSGADIQDLWDRYDLHIGHNILGYDLPALGSVLGLKADFRTCIDTLIVSHLVDFPRAGGHSLAAWGEHFQVKKVGGGIEEWDELTEEMVLRCERDVEINRLLYLKFLPYLTSNRWRAALEMEHELQWRLYEMKQNGFAFDKETALSLKATIDQEVSTILQELQTHFPPRTVPVKAVVPSLTKHGTIHRGPFKGIQDLTPYTAGAEFVRFEWQDFNPGSTKQRIDRLWEAGWQPTEKTTGHKEALRSPETPADKLEYFARYGYTTTEENLCTLPADAPEGIRKLTRWLLLAPRSRRIQEFLEHVAPDGKIHGDVVGIGAWTHRAAHSNPNTGNIPKYNEKAPETTPYSDRIRALFVASPGRCLVGVDAESIQLRVLAHYIDDPEFTASLISGRKEDGTDPHSVNMRALGPICKTRDHAKTFIYAWLLGAGNGKVADILGCSRREADDAVKKFLDRYKNLEQTKGIRVVEDAAYGYFEGFDGRYVRIPGADRGTREHLALSGYLQNGEKIVMGRALQIWWKALHEMEVRFWLVNWVHDEYQLETAPESAEVVASVVASSIQRAGESLGLKCPMAGSTLNSHGQPAIGRTWLETH